MGMDELTKPLVEIPSSLEIFDELSSEGAELGKDCRIVAVERVGTVSKGTWRLVAATERLVQ
jgi:hypothetical protein